MNQQAQGKRRLRSLVGALALGSLAVLGLTTPAHAAGPNIDPQTTGSITIHKFESPMADPELPNSGTELPDTGDLVGIPGVTFTVTPLTGVDLLTNDGWNQAAAWSANPSSIPAANLDTAAAFDLTTGPGGVIASGSLPIGAYLIEEQPLPTSNIVLPADPFMVTIPLPTTVDGDSVWITDVHVYPKNGVSSVAKTVDDSAAYALGDTVAWTIDAAIPNSFGTEGLASFVMTDQLDNRLRYETTNLSVQLVNADASVTEDLVLGTDYAFSHTGAGANGEGGTISFTLLPAGLATAGDMPSGSFVVSFETTVLEVGSGTIVNTFFANINDAEITSLPVDTKWAALRIFKHDSENTDMGLEGAVFQVFTSQTGGTPLSIRSGADGDGNDVFATDFTTGPDGTVMIPGLKAGETYWLEETVAPDRYQKLTSRVEVTGLQAGHTLEQPLVVSVSNIKIPDWQLPLTGGTGLMIPLVGVAMLLVAAGTATAVGGRRHRDSLR